MTPTVPYDINSPVSFSGYGMHRLRNGVTIDIPATHPQVFDPRNIESNWANIDVYDIDTVQQFPVGTVLKQNLRTYMYTGYLGTVAIGQHVVSAADDDDHDALAPTAALAGATEFGVTMPGSGSDDLAVNEYAGGYVEMVVNGTPGYSYEIMAHGLGDLTTTDVMTVRIFGNLAVALAATDDLAFLMHPAKDVIVAPTTLLSPTLGVCLTAQVTGQWGWAGIKGPHTCELQGTVVDGAEVRHSETTAGAVDLMDYTEATAESDSGPLGRLRNFGASTEYGLVDLYGRGFG